VEPTVSFAKVEVGAFSVAGMFVLVGVPVGVWAGVSVKNKGISLGAGLKVFVGETIGAVEAICFSPVGTPVEGTPLQAARVMNNNPQTTFLGFIRQVICLPKRPEGLMNLYKPSGRFKLAAMAQTCLG
jgi:hypothetical protein